MLSRLILYVFIISFYFCSFKQSLSIPYIPCSDLHSALITRLHFPYCLKCFLKRFFPNLSNGSSVITSAASNLASHGNPYHFHIKTPAANGCAPSEVFDKPGIPVPPEEITNTSGSPSGARKFNASKSGQNIPLLIPYNSRMISSVNTSSDFRNVKSSRL